MPSFGYCEDCGRPVAIERLRVVVALKAQEGRAFILCDCCFGGSGERGGGGRAEGTGEMEDGGEFWRTVGRA